MNRTKHLILGLALTALVAQVAGLRALARSGVLGSGDAKFHNAIDFAVVTSVLAVIALVASVAGLSRESGKTELIVACFAGILTLGHFAVWLVYGV